MTASSELIGRVEAQALDAVETRHTWTNATQLIRSFGGGCATRSGMERAMETKRRWAGCTPGANPILSIAAIVASNPGHFGQGRVGASNTNASRYGEVAAIGTSSLHCDIVASG